MIQYHVFLPLLIPVQQPFFCSQRNFTFMNTIYTYMIKGLCLKSLLLNHCLKDQYTYTILGLEHQTVLQGDTPSQ